MNINTYNIRYNDDRIGMLVKEQTYAWVLKVLVKN